MGLKPSLTSLLKTFVKTLVSPLSSQSSLKYVVFPSLGQLYHAFPLADKLKRPFPRVRLNPFLLLLVPGLDLIRLFYVRIKNGNSPLKGDLNHLHHILINKFSLKKTLFIYMLMINVPIYSYYLFSNLLLYIIIIKIIVYMLIIRNFAKN